MLVRLLLKRFVRLSRRLTGRRKALFNLLIAAIVILNAIFVTEILLKFNIGVSSLTMVYLLSVMTISCVTPDYAYGIFGAVAASLFCDFYLSEPRKSFTFTTGSPVTLITMLIVAFLTSALAERIKANARLAHDRERKWRMVSEISEKLLAVRGAEDIISHATENLREHLAPRPVVFHRTDPFSRAAAGEGVFYSSAELTRVHRIFLHPGEKDFNGPEENPGDIFYFPAIAGGVLHGVAGADCRGAPLAEADKTYLSIFISQFSMALGLQRYSDMQSSTLVESEKEKVRGTLLRTVVRDLRQPITEIIATAEGRLADNAPENAGAAEGAAHNAIAEGVINNARMLMRMVENILTVTRLNEESVAVSKEPEDAGDIVARAVASVSARFPDNLIHTRLPDESLQVPMEASLILRVLINLLENAAKHSGERDMILVDLRKQPPYARFEISDEGRGFPPDIAARLFEPDGPGREAFVDTAAGIGLGLSICKTIIRAHGGQIEGNNRNGGGARLIFKLPL